MITPLIQILIYLSLTFALGLSLGWLLWKFGKAAAKMSEVDFWKERLEQTRLERDLNQDAIARLNEEKATLKQNLRMAKA